MNQRTGSSDLTSTTSKKISRAPTKYRSLKHKQRAEDAQPLLYPEVLETASSIAAHSGLTRAEVEEIILEQLRKVVAKNYALAHPSKNADVIVEKNHVDKTLDFYNIADDQKELVHFTRSRRDSLELIGKVITIIDKMRAKREYDTFIQKKGTLVTGTIERKEHSRYVINLGRFEGFKARAFLQKNECINNIIEHRKLIVGEKITACIADIKPVELVEVKPHAPRELDDCDPRIVLSRIKPELLEELLKQHCYEIQDGIVEVKGVMRYPGHRAKVAVHSHKNDIDPIGACVGPYGTRIRPVVEELSGERIDVINWNEDLRTFIGNILAPIQMLSYKLYPPSSPLDKPYAEIATIPDDKGRAISEVKTIYRMTGVRVRIVDAQSQNTFDTEQRMNNVMKYLYIDHDFASVLINHGYSSTFAIASASPENLLAIEGIDRDIAEDLIYRAREAQVQEIAALKEEHNVDAALIDLLTQREKLGIIYDLLVAGVTTLDEAQEMHRSGDNQDADDILTLTLRAHLSEIFDNSINF